MKILTNSHLRISSYLLIGATALMSLLPSAKITALRIEHYVDRGWLHFLVYVAATTLCLLAWKRRIGLVLALALCFLSVGLQLLRASIAELPLDFFGVAVNLLGIAAGILLGLNIMTFRSRSRQESGALPNRSQSTLTRT